MKLLDSSLFSTLDITEEKQKLLKDYLFHENVQRCKLFAKLVILFEMILIALNVLATYSSNTSFINPYLIFYITLVVFSFLLLFYIFLFEKKERLTEKEGKWFQAGVLGFVSFFLLWGTVVTLWDQKEYGHVMVFAINFMCVSVLFHASNRTILTLYSLPTIVLVIGLPFFQSSTEVLFGHYVNLLVFLFFCWLASRMLYRSHVSAFYSKMLLMEKNKELAKKIEENEKINNQLQQANVSLHQLTLIDELTKIPNRRGFQSYINNALHDDKRSRTLAILMLDIDYFKLFNDHYGHIEGDHVIQMVAQNIHACIDPAVSFSARFGGEEFVVAIFDQEKRDVVELGGKIRNSVLKSRIAHNFSLCHDVVTVSIGAAIACVQSVEDVEQLMIAADETLYKAKQNGRNRFEVS
ncbi:response regulator [Halalkalibacter wakoensis JCM 9140]|uniref:Response regulator n=1 Tax=Halalkalibacter wakoensis JCM 9140 TaxID=1236970 RepID=W4PZ53_9BACI|nr:GGDEF domain-containing protein [Halalkalibacter wakoensis]GAE24935.1 response regulator [Halalkalibacter wakoensis JCM 9140]